MYCIYRHRRRDVEIMIYLTPFVECAGLGLPKLLELERFGEARPVLGVTVTGSWRGGRECRDLRNRRRISRGCVNP